LGESARLHQPFCPSFVPLFVVEAVRATEEYRRIGREMWVRMDKIMCAVLREAHERQIEETMDALSDGPERFYESYLDGT
jgi:tRNA threonylcarbamoyladenosine modification (KEOPS) complex Cgi121 subunit